MFLVEPNPNPILTRISCTLLPRVAVSEILAQSLFHEEHPNPGINPTTTAN